MSRKTAAAAALAAMLPAAVAGLLVGLSLAAVYLACVVMVSVP